MTLAGGQVNIGGAPSPVRVVYVLGWYRSGTTLLGNLLGQLPGFVSVGELQALWHALSHPESLCGCGLTLGYAPFGPS